MEPRVNSPFSRIDRPVLAAIGIVLAGATVFVAWSDRQHEFRRYQCTFRNMVTAKLGADRASAMSSGIQQIWVPGLRRADRCITCHQAVSWRGFETAEEPYRTHPVGPLKIHPPERFGCSVCHGGQGWATDTAAAHGEVAHWEEPLLARALGEAYSLAGDKGALLQMNCNICHRYERETQGADMINLAKQLVRDKGCRACHVVNSRGGMIGPDLTWVGDKAPEQFDYSRLSGRPTAFAWHVAHLKDPRALVKDTVMPNFHLSTKEAQAISMLVVSWRKSPLDAALLPGVPRSDPQGTDERKSEEDMKTGPGAWFVQTGCFVCHSIGALNVRSQAQIGPDLSTAAEDTQRRFGLTVDQFLKNPTGTMSAVLARQIVLTPAQRDLVIGKLHEAFAEYQRLVARGKNPLAAPAAHPPKSQAGRPVIGASARLRSPGEGDGCRQVRPPAQAGNRMRRISASW